MINASSSGAKHAANRRMAPVSRAKARGLYSKPLFYRSSLRLIGVSPLPAAALWLKLAARRSGKLRIRRV
jgi:hypothetical protein